MSRAELWQDRISSILEWYGQLQFLKLFMGKLGCKDKISVRSIRYLGNSSAYLPANILLPDSFSGRPLNIGPTLIVPMTA
jgi:hypothetical protein